MLGRIRGNLISDCANSVYTACIRPIMDYCDTCGTAAELATVHHWRGFKDVPLKLFQN